MVKHRQSFKIVQFVNKHLFFVKIVFILLPLHIYDADKYWRQVASKQAL